MKSELEKLEEEAMISELVELVERRDQLLWALHLEKGRYGQHPLIQSISTIISVV